MKGSGALKWVIVVVHVAVLLENAKYTQGRRGDTEPFDMLPNDENTYEKISLTELKLTTAPKSFDTPAEDRKMSVILRTNITYLAKKSVLTTTTQHPISINTTSQPAETTNLSRLTTTSHAISSNIALKPIDTTNSSQTITDQQSTSTIATIAPEPISHTNTLRMQETTKLTTTQHPSWNMTSLKGDTLNTTTSEPQQTIMTTPTSTTEPQLILTKLNTPEQRSNLTSKRTTTTKFPVQKTSPTKKKNNQITTPKPKRKLITSTKKQLDMTISKTQLTTEQYKTSSTTIEPKQQLTEQTTEQQILLINITSLEQSPNSTEIALEQRLPLKMETIITTLSNNNTQSSLNETSTTSASLTATSQAHKESTTSLGDQKLPTNDVISSDKETNARFRKDIPFLNETENVILSTEKTLLIGGVGSVNDGICTEIWLHQIQTCLSDPWNSQECIIKCVDIRIILSVLFILLLINLFLIFIIIICCCRKSRSTKMNQTESNKTVPDENYLNETNHSTSFA